MGRLTLFIGSLPQHKPVSKGGRVTMKRAYNRFKKEWRKNMPSKASITDLLNSLGLSEATRKELHTDFINKHLWHLKQAADAGILLSYNGIGPATVKKISKALKDVHEPFATDTTDSPPQKAAGKPDKNPKLEDLLDAIHALVQQQAAIIVEFQNAVANFGEAVDILKRLALQQKAMWDEAQAAQGEATSKADAAGSNITEALRTGQPPPAEPPPPDAQPMQGEMFVPDGVFIAPSDTGFPAPDEDDKTGNFNPDRVPGKDEQASLRQGMWSTAHECHWETSAVKHMAGIIGTGQNPLSLDAGTWNAILTNLESRAAKDYWVSKYYKRYPNRKP